jgi:hypothetical protein
MTTPSPMDDYEAPEELTARVVSPEPCPRLHGFDVQGDLVRNYDFAEVVFTALVGRTPERHEGRGLNVLMGFLLPICVAEAPSHGAVIARLCGAQSQRVVATAAVALCEQARFELDRHAPLLEWLEQGCQGPPPASCAGADRQEQDAVERLHDCLQAAGMSVPAQDSSLSLPAAIIVGLFACGLTLTWQLEAIWCLARLPAVASEAMAVSPGAFSQYPIRQPTFVLDPRRDDDR